MAPRRHQHGHAGQLATFAPQHSPQHAVQNGVQPVVNHPPPNTTPHIAQGPIVPSPGPGLVPNNNVFEPDVIEKLDGNLTRCCVPGECLRVHNSNNNAKDVLIRMDDLRDAVKVVCNNDHCTMGQYMHRECFDQFEQTVLTYLKSCGRARSWSERQRHQNLWTKKGYDLAFKACGCRCGRGHIKKDLDWTAPPPASVQGATFRDNDQENGGKRKKKRNKNARPALAVSAHVNSHHTGSNNNGINGEMRGRTGSLSSGSTGSSSPPAATGCMSPAHVPAATAPMHQRRKNSKLEFFSDRHASSGNGIFCRRQDFSSFNVLPKHKLNSYHIKMEDEGNHGNDETRCFILSTLAAQQQNRAPCLLCGASMPVFDRYPLVDGTFFLSPRQHSKACVQVKVEGRQQYLSAVCMRCLEFKAARCRYCGDRWDGSSLVLGTMYSYDIFAAIPCCPDRLKCNSCSKPLLSTSQRLNYYSDYSQEVACPHCGVQDTHFIKPLPSCFTLAAHHIPITP